MWGNGPATLDDHGGQSFFDENGIPVLMHWLDAPQWAHRSQVLDAPRWMFNGKHSYHCINNGATAQEMVGVLGFDNIITMTNAASPTSFAPTPLAQQDFDIIFGVAEDTVQPTPLMLRELQRDEPDIQAIRMNQADLLRDQLCNFLGPHCTTPADAESLIDRVLEVRLACRHAGVLEQLRQVARCAPVFAQAVLALMQDAKAYVGFSSTLREIESWERAFTFAYLSRSFRCATFGFQSAFQAWPGQWEYLGELPYHQQSAAYGRGWFGLNVMRWQDDIGLNLKPFEITLSGTCLLQAYRVGIDDHFGPSEAVVFHTPQECRARVESMLAHKQEITEIAEAGHARSIRQHCWRHRAEKITPILASNSAHAPPLASALSSASSGFRTEICAETDTVLPWTRYCMTLARPNHEGLSRSQDGLTAKKHSIVSLACATTLDIAEMLVESKIVRNDS
jgi:hypothetical protein